jgi:hypothetical protein
MKVILLNGPKRSGKDYIAERVALLGGMTVRSMMQPMKIAALTLRGLHPDTWLQFETRKDEPAPELDGQTPREVYIAHGTMMRERYGQNFVANLWMRHTSEARGCNDIIVPDVRFAPEVDAVVRLVGARNVVLVGVHRKGTNWDNDIGSYLSRTFGGIKRLDFDNNYEGLHPGDVVHSLLESWLNT